MPNTLLHSPKLVSSHDHSDRFLRLPHEAWLPVLQHPCDFGPGIFEDISLNLLKNPNINSSLLFRADILHDSNGDELTDEVLPKKERDLAIEGYAIGNGELPGFKAQRTILRRMIPRNPQLDKPILQTCLFLTAYDTVRSIEKSLVIYIPHAPSVDDMPWYHPRVQSLAYLHSWQTLPTFPDSQGSISLHYRLFPTEALPFTTRLERTGQHLLSTLHRHGQGRLNGYQKRVHHDQLVPQQRIQNTYSELKKKHAKRLCDAWIEKTEPSKHVFEDLGIAAFLIELWRDMYGGETVSSIGEQSADRQAKDSFPGFVDIGCGNGVLVDVLTREGYQGWGFDARKRKTWSTFDPSIQKYLKQMILIPEPFVQGSPQMKSPDQPNRALDINSLSATLRHTLLADHPISSHNGIFPMGTFIISNHADELTPWTPLLASLSSSPFLCIPCCSHNLSGQRFRAPSVFNSNSADALAPSYFADHINTAKSIPINVADTDDDEIYGPNYQSTGPAAEKGDLHALSQKARTKQPSAYASLCDWVASLAVKVGYEVEKEMLRLPSTRNMGVVGRTWRKGFEVEAVERRHERVQCIVREEKADKAIWVQRPKGLAEGQGSGH